MTWPRAAAIAEDAWTARENKDWDSFRVRMLKDFERLDAGEVGYCRSFWDVIFRYDNRNGYPRHVEMECNCPDTEIRYTFGGTGDRGPCPRLYLRWKTGRKYKCKSVLI